jgi:hypothetical protein
VRWLVLLLFFPLHSLAQANQTLLVDLKDKWLIHRSEKFVEFDNHSTNSVFFWVDAREEQGNFLLLDGKRNYSVFVNSKLILQRKGKVKLPIDSLSQKYSRQLLIGLFSSTGVNHLQAKMERPVHSTAGFELVPRSENYFLNFSILASLLLLICFVLFLQTNPTLTLDYLNVNKLFSFQDRDESTLTLRIASSVNLLIYFFTSVFLGLMLLITYHFMGDQVSIANWVSIRSMAQAFWQWSILSMIIFCLLVVKLLWLVLMSAMFGFRETVRIQFFNFVRLIVLAMLLLTAISVVYFMFNIREQHYFFHLLTILSIIFVIGAFATYFKLVARMPFHSFHLFSYLCATEIIPLIVLIKAFFY